MIDYFDSEILKDMSDHFVVDHKSQQQIRSM